MFSVFGDLRIFCGFYFVLFCLDSGFSRRFQVFSSGL